MKIQTILYQNLLSFSWVIAFLLLCFFLYEEGSKARALEFKQLKEQFAFLEAEKQKAIKIQRDLQLQVNSQSDMAWMELTLMQGAGVCPEDQQKVYFFNDVDG